MIATARAALLSILAVALACRHGATAPSAEPVGTGFDASDADPGTLFLRAWTQNGRGDPDGALATLREVDARGWDVPLDPRDFAGLADRAEWRAIAERVAARAPRTAHAPVAVTLREPGLVAEGIAAHPSDGTLYVGSIRLRKIVRVAPDGTVRDVVPSATSGVGSVLGLKVDAERGLLWAAANRGDAGGGAGRAGTTSGVYAFDLETGAPVRAVRMDGAGHLLNDLALGSDGTLFVTDSEAGAVHRLDPGASSLAEVVAKGTFFYANGIAFAEGRLLVADALGLWEVNPRGGAPRRLAGPAGFPLGGIDGLSAQGRTLIAVQNGLGTPRIVRLELAAGAERVERASVLEAANPQWHVPTTGALAGGAFHYIGNSHVDGWKDATLDPAGMVETRLHRLDLGPDAAPRAGGR